MSFLANIHHVLNGDVNLDHPQPVSIRTTGDDPQAISQVSTSNTHLDADPHGTPHIPSQQFFTLASIYKQHNIHQALHDEQVRAKAATTQAHLKKSQQKKQQKEQHKGRQQQQQQKEQQEESPESSEQSEQPEQPEQPEHPEQPDSVHDQDSSLLDDDEHDLASPRPPSSSLSSSPSQPTPTTDTSTFNEAWHRLNVTLLSHTHLLTPPTSPLLTIFANTPAMIDPYRELRQRFGSSGSLLPKYGTNPVPTQINGRRQVTRKMNSVLSPGFSAVFPAGCSIALDPVETCLFNGFAIDHIPKAIPTTTTRNTHETHQHHHQHSPTTTTAVLDSMTSHTSPIATLPVRFYKARAGDDLTAFPLSDILPRDHHYLTAAHLFSHDTMVGTHTGGGPSVLGGPNLVACYTLHTQPSLQEQLQMFLRIQNTHDYHRLIAFCQEHPQLPHALYHLSHIYEYHGRNADAFDMLRIGVVLFESILGKDVLAAALNGKVRLIIGPSRGGERGMKAKEAKLMSDHAGDVSASSLSSAISNEREVYEYELACNAEITRAYIRLLARYGHFLSKKACNRTSFGITTLAMQLTNSIYIAYKGAVSSADEKVCMTLYTYLLQKYSDALEEQRQQAKDDVLSDVGGGDTSPHQSLSSSSSSSSTSIGQGVQLSTSMSLAAVASLHHHSTPTQLVTSDATKTAAAAYLPPCDVSQCVQVDIHDLSHLLTYAPREPVALHYTDPSSLRYFMDYYGVKGRRYIDVLKMALHGTTLPYGAPADTRQSLPSTTSLAEALFVNTTGVFSQLISSMILNDPSYTATRVAVPCSVYTATLIAPLAAPPFRFMINWAYSMALSLYHLEQEALPLINEAQARKQQHGSSSASPSSSSSSSTLQQQQQQQQQHHKHHKGGKRSRNRGRNQIKLGLQREIDLHKSTVLTLDEQITAVRQMDILSILSLDTVSIKKGRIVMNHPYVGYPLADQYIQSPTAGSSAMTPPPPCNTIVLSTDHAMLLPTSLPSLAYLVRAVLLYPEAAIQIVQGQSYHGGDWSHRTSVLGEAYPANSYITRVSDVFSRRAAPLFRITKMQQWFTAAVDLVIEFLTVNPHTNKVLKQHIPHARNMIYNVKFYHSDHPLRKLEETQYCDDVVQPPQEELMPEILNAPMSFGSRLSPQQQQQLQQRQPRRGGGRRGGGSGIRIQQRGAPTQAAEGPNDIPLPADFLQQLSSGEMMEAIHEMMGDSDPATSHQQFLQIIESAISTGDASLMNDLFQQLHLLGVRDGDDEDEDDDDNDDGALDDNSDDDAN